MSKWGTRNLPKYDGRYKLSYPDIKVSATETAKGNVSIEISHAPGALDRLEIVGWEKLNYADAWPKLLIEVKRKAKSKPQ